MTKLWLVMMMTMTIAMAGCDASGEARADPIQPRLGQVFTLSVGQEAMISGDLLRLQFEQVLEDSRCPATVECFWTGQARITVVVRQAQADPTTVEFNTNPAPGANKQAVDIGDYTIELRALDPYPETTDDTLALEHYRASLLVRSSE